jgi:hypothetical protein
MKTVILREKLRLYSVDRLRDTTYIRGVFQFGGAPVSTETQTKEMHAEAHVLVKTWKQSTAEFTPALAA